MVLHQIPEKLLQQIVPRSEHFMFSRLKPLGIKPQDFGLNDECKF
jgi:hypothetical protein